MSCSDRNLIGMSVCCLLLNAGYCLQSSSASFLLVKFDEFIETERLISESFLLMCMIIIFPLKVSPMFFLLIIGGKIMVDTNCQGY